MAETEPKTRSPWVILALIIVALIGGLGGWLLGSRQQPTDRKAIEDIVRNYILEHPEVLPQAIQRLEARENGKQVASAGNALTAPFPGAVLGNPNGAITLVEFTDYACGYCRASRWWSANCQSCPPPAPRQRAGHAPPQSRESSPSFTRPCLPLAARRRTQSRPPPAKPGWTLIAPASSSAIRASKRRLAKT